MDRAADGVLSSSGDLGRRARGTLKQQLSERSSEASLGYGHPSQGVRCAPRSPSPPRWRPHPPATPDDRVIVPQAGGVRPAATENSRNPVVTSRSPLHRIQFRQRETAEPQARCLHQYTPGARCCPQGSVCLSVESNGTDRLAARQQRLGLMPVRTTRGAKGGPIPQHSGRPICQNHAHTANL
jgi:hypothetical protein